VPGCTSRGSAVLCGVVVAVRVDWACRISSFCAQPCATAPSKAPQHDACAAVFTEARSRGGNARSLPSMRWTETNVGCTAHAGLRLPRAAAMLRKGYS
jgi:hypothetical protein